MECGPESDGGARWELRALGAPVRRKRQRSRRSDGVSTRRRAALRPAFGRAKSIGARSERGTICPTVNLGEEPLASGCAQSVRAPRRTGSSCAVAALPVFCRLAAPFFLLLL